MHARRPSAPATDTASHSTLVLVDPDDRAVGVAEKLEAHRRGWLHRAFSVLVFRSTGELLLQERAAQKYHSAGLWSNTCCGHPRPEEPVLDGASRRLQEEMGFSCALERRFGFVYRATLGNGLIEHEYDHVLVGSSDRVPVPDLREVGAWQWLSPAAVDRELAHRPHRYTVWFRELWTRRQQWLA